MTLIPMFNFFKKLFTHNYCDTCGFTKDTVCVTEHWIEAGLIQCEKCYNQDQTHEQLLEIYKKEKGL